MTDDRGQRTDDRGQRTVIGVELSVSDKEFGGWEI